MLYDFYYTLKPLIPRPVQILMRRQHAGWLLSRVGYRWPIDDTASGPPPGWSGWPEGKRFALVLTHDVESARGVDKCIRLSETEESLGFRSSFNFVAEDYYVPEQLRNDLAKRGFEIGLHGVTHKINPFKSRDIFQEQVIKINRYLKDWGAVGFRCPCVYRNLEWICDMNIDYDASTFDTDPFQPQPDGAGTIFPFWVSANPAQKGYVELPYTLPQDHTLYVVMQEKDNAIWKKKIDWIAARGGMALFIVHPDYMHFSGERQSREEYPASHLTDFLEYIKSRHEGEYWHVLPREMARFWAKNYRRSGQFYHKHLR
mgnify:CR=1 FL=1